MSLFTKLANYIFSPVDASGAQRSVMNADAQVWGAEIERLIMALVAEQGGDIDLPNLLIRYAVTGGTANDIIATPNLPVPDAPGLALFSIQITHDNTGPVTINGKPVRTNSGNEIVPGGLTAPSMPVFVDLGDHYRLMSDQASASIVAAAEGWAIQAGDRAEAADNAADRAEGFAAMQSADKVKFKTVPLLIADTLMSYTDEPGKIHVGPGDVIEAGGFRYEVAASGATDHHVETAGGVKLNLQQNSDLLKTQAISLLRISEDVTYRVPTDYPTMYDAVHAQAGRLGDGLHSVTILLESGYEIERGIELIGGDWSFMRIAAEDPIVPITDNFEFATGKIFYFRHCSAPILDLLIDMRKIGTDFYSTQGVRYWDASGTIMPGAGVINSYGRGLHVVGGVVRAEGTIWDGAGSVGIRASNSGIIQARAASAKNCGLDTLSTTIAGVSAAGNSYISAHSIDASGSYVGASCIDGAILDLGTDANLSQTVAYAIEVNGPGIISASNLTVAEHVSVQCVRAEHGGTIMLRGGTIETTGIAFRGDHGSRIIAVGTEVTGHQTLAFMSSGASFSTDFVIAEESTGAQIRLDSGGKIAARRSNLSYSGSFAVMAHSGSEATFDSCNLSFSSGFVLDIQNSRVTTISSDLTRSGSGARVRGGTLSAQGTNFRQVEGTDHATNLQVESGGIIQAHNCQGGTIQTPGTISAAGIIWKS